MTGIWIAFVGASLAAGFGQDAKEATLTIDAGRVLHKVSPYLHGACIEDVNHEIYGGLYSQMIFGEGFQEPSPLPLLKGFNSLGGRWRPHEGELLAGAGDGPKLVAFGQTISVGTVQVEVRLPSAHDGNAGLILKVNDAGVGADRFTGYEVSLESRGRLVLGRHRQNWEPLRDVPCKVPINRWVKLAVKLRETSLDVLVDDNRILTYEDTEHPLAAGVVGLRTWRRPAMYRNFSIQADGSVKKIPFEPVESSSSNDAVSGMWSAVRRGNVQGEAAIETTNPFVGMQAQRLTFREGEGEIGVENRGLNRWGMRFKADEPYEGYVWVRTERPTKLNLSLESGDGSKTLASTVVEASDANWSRLDFKLKPERSENSGRFTIKLTQPGSVVLGHAFLQPGEWGRFKGLPARKDVVEGLIDQGVTVLRYGGSMVNHPQYRWKEMIGPRDRRPNHAGTWYPYSSNGWGIFDFLDVCEAAGFLAIPDVNVNETPQDMADFIEYVNGPADSPWGRKRAADGHPNPYLLKHLELGNEEAVNEAYWKKFEPLAEAIWAKDPDIILVVGDFAYSKVIEDPYKFEGGEVVNTLEAHRKILELARARGREVWFDIHVTTDHPPQPRDLAPERSFIEQLGKIAPGARYKVVFFEYNSGNHSQRRAISNALATNQAERIGDLLPIACAANCLQPDGQNDNGWDQGLLFLNPSKVWLQPPGYLVRMGRRQFQPLLVRSELGGHSETLSVNAKKSEDGKTLVLQVVNWGDEPQATRIEVKGFSPSKTSAAVEQMAGPLEAANSAEDPDRIRSSHSEWQHGLGGGKSTYTFPARSITFVRIE